MSNPDLAWGIWLAATLATFAALETWALYAQRSGKDPGTLTGTMRRWLGIQPQRRRRYLLGAVFAGFLIWLAGHFLLGWPP